MFCIVILLAIATHANANDVSALLHFKSHVSDPLSTLHSWNESTNSCQWEGIKCRNDTHIITGLHLHSLSLLSSPLVANIVDSLPELRGLHITNSNFIDMIHSMSFRNCSSLNVLNLSFNQLRGNYPYQLLDACQNIKLLNLSHNQLHQVTFINNMLEKIDLSYNNFSSEFSSLSFPENNSLRYLDLSNNFLAGRVSQDFLQNCTALKELSLAFNNLSGVFPSLNVSNRIQRLILTSNSFTAFTIHSSSACENLIELDISSNQCLKPVFLSKNVVCPSLKLFNISGNFMTGNSKDVSFLRSLPSVEILDASHNNLTGEISQIHDNLRYLNLSSNTYQTVSENLCSSSSALESLILSNNLLTGEVFKSVLSCTGLQMLDLSFNSITEEIPSSLCERLPNLLYFLAWANNIEGQVPESLGSCTKLAILSLSYNKLRGPIPVQLSQLTHLVWLDLSNNRFTGNIPPSFGLLKKMHVLQLVNNHLEGEIPRELEECESLNLLEVTSNSLSGTLPIRIGRRKTAYYLMNMFDARLNSTLASLQIVKGIPPRCKGLVVVLPLQGIRIEDLEKKMTRLNGCNCKLGLMPSFIWRNVTSLVALDISHNKIEGNIPTEFGEMQSMQGLLVANNSLSGTIPVSIGNITDMSSLDLSFNFFQGEIPDSLSKLSFLRELNLSYNNLSGPIPQTGQMSTFTASSFLGNQYLCGLPLSSQCKASIPIASNPFSDNEQDHRDIVLASVISGLVAFIACIPLGLILGSKLQERARVKTH